MVLAAGWGTRLRPFTYTLPKHLLPVAGKPVIRHVLDMIASAGIEEIGIVVSPATLELFRRALAPQTSVHITYILQPEPKGLAHAMLCAQGFVGHEDFLMVLGDNLLGEGLGPILTKFKREQTHIVALSAVDEPQRFGVAVVEDDRILRLVEKPKEPPSHWAVVGVYLFRPSIFSAACDLPPSPRGELEITDAIQRLVEEGEPVRAHFLQDWWQDVGRPADLLAAQARLFTRLLTGVAGHVHPTTHIHGTVVIESGATVKNSCLQGPLWIGQGAVVEDAALGPNVALGPGARAHSTRLRDCIVMEEAWVEGVFLTKSVLGRRAQVRGTGQASLILGDESQVQVEGG